MRCKFLVELEVSGADPRQVEGNTIARRVTRNGQLVERLFWKVGAVVEHPEAYLLVRQGMAVPDDGECANAASMSTEGMAAAQHAAKRLIARIHPSDFAAYDAGYLSGYNPDGSWKPGANGGQEEWLEKFEPEDDEDDE